MSSTEWDHLGENIRDIVDSAVNSRDYAKLNQSINSVVSMAAKGMEAGAQAASKSLSQWQAKMNESQRIVDVRLDNRQLFTKVSNHQVVGILLLMVGSGLTFTLGLTAMAFVLAAFIAGGMSLFFLTLIVLLLFCVAFFGVLSKGWRLLLQARRFKRYVNALRGKEYANLDYLANEVNKPLKFVRKDIETMILKNWFRQGHLDKQKSCLMVTDRMYDEYLQHCQQAEALRIEEEKKAKALEQRAQEQYGQSNLNQEERKVLDEGNRFIEKIRQCNDDIPGEEISNKISKMENIVQRIFARVQAHKENIPDIQKLMDYYLPTTVKLLEAYKELDDQPVQGENIQKSKTEIENTLDTLNGAFEKLLDELFRDTAWDVSSDISVLNTMLAQEGLTKGDFK